MRREPGEPLNPVRVSAAEIERLKVRIAPHVFASQYQQRPASSGTGYCSIERLARYPEAPPFELIVHSWDIASTKGGGDWTVCAKFGLAKDPDGRDILYLIGVVRMQVELPDVREAIIAHDALDKPAIIVMDGNGIGRGPYQDLWARGFRHLLPGESMTSSASDNLKIRRFSEGLFSLYDGLVRLPNAMPGQALETLLAEIAAFPDGKHDDQVDALSCVAAYHARVIHEARHWGLKLGRSRPPSAPGPDRSADIARSGAPRSATATGLGLTRFSATGHPRDILSVGSVAANWLRSPVSRRLRDAGAERPARHTPQGVKQPSPDTASAADQIFACRELRLHSKRTEWRQPRPEAVRHKRSLHHSLWRGGGLFQRRWNVRLIERLGPQIVV